MCVAYMKIQTGIATHVAGIYLYLKLLKTTFCVGSNVAFIMTLLCIATGVSGI